MSRARRRNSTNSTEALLKAVMAVFILVALAIGGIGHFAQVLSGLIYGALLLFLFGGAAFLIVISRLRLLKKAALLLVLASIGLVLVWRARIAPTPWPSVQATVIRVVEPTYTAKCTYEYVTGGEKFPFNTTHTWASVDEAKRRTPGELTLYINPMNPAEATDKSTTRWIRTTAKLTHGDVNPDGVFEANARYSVNLTSYQAVFRGEGA